METQFISLNMTPNGVNPIFHISQYDVGRVLGFYVYNGSEVVDLDDYTCTVEATRTDGTQITTNVITNNNSGIFAVTATMSNVADKYNCQLVIVDRNTNRVASLPFIMDVVTAALNGNDSSIYNDRTLYQQYNASMQASLANEANNRINADNLEKATRQSAVNTLQNNINAEASTRASADSNLQSQINQIVAPSGEAPSAAEVQNARIGADGVTYDTLGTAIRSQVNNLKEDIIDLDELFNWDADKTNILNGMTPVVGAYVNYENGGVGKVDNYEYYEISVTEGQTFKCNGNNVHVAFFSKKYNGTAEYYLTGLRVMGKMSLFTVPKNAVSMTVSVPIDGSSWLGNGDDEYRQNTTLKEECLPEQIIAQINDINEDLDEHYFRTSYSLGYANVVLDDANNAKPNMIYKIDGTLNEYYPKNLPVTTTGFLVCVTSQAKNYERYYTSQYILDDQLKLLWFRKINNINKTITYGEWKKPDGGVGLYNTSFFNYPQNLVNNQRIVKNAYIDGNSGGYGVKDGWDFIIFPVTSDNKYQIKGITRCHYAFFSSVDIPIISNYISGNTVLPEKPIVAPANAKCLTVSFRDEESGDLWINTDNVDYFPPKLKEKFIPNTEKHIYVEKDGSGDYTKLIDALAYGMEHKNTTIYLGAGDFDLIEEHGSQYFEDFVFTTYTNMGPMIGNGTHLICSPKSRILCNYTGDNDEVKKGYSPLNPCATNTFGIGDFVIEGATIIASNVRYCVHDDVGIQVVPYKHEYIRCNMYLDNSNRSYEGVTGHTHRCIGGGMGIAGTIVVKDCIFDGVGDADNIAVAWHNDNYTQQPMGYIVIEGNYFRGNNTVEIKSISQYTEKTHVILRNNSLGSNYVYGKWGPNTAPDNMEVLAWGNEIRSN